MIEKNEPILPEISPTIEPIVLPPPSTLKLNYKIIISIFLMLAIITISLVFAFNQNKKIVQNTPSPTKISTPSNIPTKYIAPTQEPTPTPISIKASSLNMGDITWSQKPIIIDLNTVFKSEYIESDLKDAKFQLSGISTKGFKIVSFMYSDPWRKNINRLIIDPNDKKYIMLEPTAEYLQSFYSLDNIPVVLNDIPGIQSPKIIETKAGNFNRTKYSRGSIIYFSELINQKYLVNTQYGDLYSSVHKYSTTDGNGGVSENPDGLFSRSFLLKLSDGTFVEYLINIDFFLSDYESHIPNITWLDNTQNTEKFYFGPVIKCGPNTNHFYPKDYFSKSALTLTGHTVSGQEIYKIIDKTNPVAIDSYNHRYTYNNPDIEKLSVEEFLQLPSHFLWQDFMGDWHLFYSNKYFSNNYGCS